MFVVKVLILHGSGKRIHAKTEEKITGRKFFG